MTITRTRIASLIVLMTISWLLSSIVSVSVTSFTQSISVGVSGARLWICVRDSAYRDSATVPRPGWSMSWVPLGPFASWRIIGYPGSTWYVLPLLFPYLGITVGIILLYAWRVQNHAGRCKHCGYCLSGLYSRTCPECGNAVVPISYMNENRTVN